MNSNFDQDIRRILNLWRGKVSFKNIKGTQQLEMMKKYKLTVDNEGQEKTIVLKRIMKIAEGYPFLTIEGSYENILLKAVVRPNSIEMFEEFCNTLNKLEENKEVECVA